jgi:hypothetical protein
MNVNISTTTTDCDVSHPECFSPETVDPWETDYAALVPRFTGSLSAISSTLIIYVIMRSQTRLSSIYHRIMFGMSLADVFSSIAMALTSLPMPSHMPKEEVFGYSWAGTRLGNEYTCNAQGFFQTSGIVCMYAYNAMLCVYYACAIALTMREKNIKKYVEPFLHGMPVILGTVNGLLPLLQEMYNPWRYPWCAPVPYPIACTDKNQELECIRGSAKANRQRNELITYLIICFFLVIVSSLVMVVWKVISTERSMTHISKLYGKRGFKEMQRILKKHANTKVVLIQAISYIAAFLVSLLPAIVLLIGVDNRLPSKTIKEFEKLSLVLMPLQGFFNGVIFISHKVYNYRRTHPKTSICYVLRLLLTTSTHDPLFISRISVIKQNELEAARKKDNYGIDLNEGGPNQSNVSYEFRIQDESNEECLLHLGGGADDMNGDSEGVNHNCSGKRCRPNEETPDFYQSSPDVMMTTNDGASEEGAKSACGACSSEIDGMSYDFSNGRLSHSSRCTGTGLWNVGSSFEENTVDEEQVPQKKIYYQNCNFSKIN